MNLTEEQWRAEFARIADESNKAGGTGAEGFATEDIAHVRNVSMTHAHALITRWQDLGLVRYNGRQVRPNRVGGVKTVPVYIRVKAQNE